MISPFFYAISFPFLSLSLSLSLSLLSIPCIAKSEIMGFKKQKQNTHFQYSHHEIPIRHMQFYSNQNPSITKPQKPIQSILPRMMA